MLFEPVSARLRLLFFALWLALVLFLSSMHVPWRDEARAFALATETGWSGLFAAVQGEGHPLLWYVILKGAHGLVGTKAALPLAGLLIGVLLALLVALKAPFRGPVLLLVLFSYFLVWDQTILSRNYGLVTLLLFAIAAWWPRIKDRLWLGCLLFLLANSAVPAVILGGGIMLFRLLELLSQGRAAPRQEWLRFVGNGAVFSAGILLCFVTVYPSANDAAALKHGQPLTLVNLLLAVVANERSFGTMTLVGPAHWGALLLLLSSLLFVRRPAALVAVLVTFAVFRAFFFFVYPAQFRHSTLFLVFLLSMVWMLFHDERPGAPRAQHLFEKIGGAALLLLLLFQVILTAVMSQRAAAGVPASRAADVARLIEEDPRLRGAIVMGEPDTWLESVAYQLGRPVWMIRQGRFDTVSPLTMNARKRLTLDDFLADAQRLHRASGRPVVILLWARDKDLAKPQVRDLMFFDQFVIEPASVQRFRAATTRVASLPPALIDETYDVYVYPALTPPPAPAPRP